MIYSFTALHSEEQGKCLLQEEDSSTSGRREKKSILISLIYDTNEWKLFINPELHLMDLQKTVTKGGCFECFP